MRRDIMGRRIVKKTDLYQLLIDVAASSPAKKRKVGALLVKPLFKDFEDAKVFTVLSTGYNYNPSGGPCETEDNLTHENVIHAEVACVLNFLNGKTMQEAINFRDVRYPERMLLISSHQPCTGCQAFLKSYNINYIVWRKDPMKDEKKDPFKFENLTSSSSKTLSDMEKTLAERGSRYGDFSDNARIYNNIRECIIEEKGFNRLRPVHKLAIDVIAQKIARIVNGDPEYKDNWHDIAGYAKLAEDRCMTTENAEQKD